MQHFNPLQSGNQQFGTQQSIGALFNPGQSGMQQGGTLGVGQGYNQQQMQQGQGQAQGQGQGQGQGQAAQFGAHEVMQAHEVLSSMVEGINRFNLYREHISDQRLASIMDRHLNHMNQSYNNITSYLQHRGSMSSMPYHGEPKSQVQYGLRTPSPVHPSNSPQNINDRDVAMGMLSYHKSSAVFSTLATLECADPTLRQLMQDSANSCMNQAWECFTFMNQNGMYQVPTMQQNTTNTMINMYQ